MRTPPVRSICTQASLVIMSYHFPTRFRVLSLRTAARRRDATNACREDRPRPTAAPCKSFGPPGSLSRANPLARLSSDALVLRTRQAANHPSSPTYLHCLILPVRDRPVVNRGAVPRFVLAIFVVVFPSSSSFLPASTGVRFLLHVRHRRTVSLAL